MLNLHKNIGVWILTYLKFNDVVLQKKKEKYLLKDKVSSQCPNEAGFLNQCYNQTIGKSCYHFKMHLLQQNDAK